MSTLTVHRDISDLRELELEEVFREHYPMLYRTAYSILNRSADAEDVTCGRVRRRGEVGIRTVL